VTRKEVDRWLRGLLHHQSDPSRMTRLEGALWQTGLQHYQSDFSLRSKGRRERKIESVATDYEIIMTK
jgi:hypothetical protein